jgi:hypothetical protein
MAGLSTAARQCRFVFDPPFAWSPSMASRDRLRVARPGHPWPGFRRPRGSAALYSIRRLHGRHPWRRVIDFGSPGPAIHGRAFVGRAAVPRKRASSTFPPVPFLPLVAFVLNGGPVCVFAPGKNKNVQGATS